MWFLNLFKKQKQTPITDLKTLRTLNKLGGDLDRISDWLISLNFRYTDKAVGEVITRNKLILLRGAIRMSKRRLKQLQIK